MIKPPRCTLLTLWLLLLLWPWLAVADRPVYRIEIKNHLFYPAEISVPSDTKFILEITNRDLTPEEFDSFDLNREKVVFPQRTVTLYIGPLAAGQYDFFGEFNPNSAQGKVIVEAASHAH